MRANPDPEGRNPTAHDESRSDGVDRHRAAVVQAEARRLARIIKPFGVLHRSQLERRARAVGWHEGSFDDALHTAIELGEIKSLPLGFYARSDWRNAATQ